MFRKSILLGFLFAAVFFTVGGFAQSTDEIRLGIAPVEPFRIIGNIYYVGSSDLTSYLIVTTKGNILIDSGMKEMLPQIKANVERLGFRLSDIKIILNSHAHFDHAGGIAELRRLTGARFIASELDSPQLKRGGLNDPNFGDKYPFDPIKPDETFKNHKVVTLGGSKLRANLTAGHTRGCTTWTTTVKENGRSLNVMFICSISSPDYQLVDNKMYPDIESDFLRSFEWFKNAKVDVFLASHARFFDLAGKTEKLRMAEKPNPFIDSEGYRRFVAGNEQTFIEKLKSQKAAKGVQ